MQVIRVPLRYAIERDEAKTDPFTKIKPAYEMKREKGVLTKEEAMALIDAPVLDCKYRLAVLLGLLCGMRLGEVRGIHGEDIDFKTRLIHIRHNWQDMEGIKPPKNSGIRDVPLPQVICRILALLQKEQKGRKSPKTPLVFDRGDGKPFSNGYFRLALIKELHGIGVSPAMILERNISFHSLRHTFVSLVRLAGINDFQTQALTGHKTPVMMEHYSHPRQVIALGECGTIIDGFFKTA